MRRGQRCDRDEDDRATRPARTPGTGERARRVFQVPYSLSHTLLEPSGVVIVSHGNLELGKFRFGQQLTIVGRLLTSHVCLCPHSVCRRMTVFFSAGVGCIGYGSVGTEGEWWFLQLQGGPQFQQHPARFPVGRRHQRCQRGAATAISAAAGGRRGVLRIVLSSAGPILEAAASQPANQPTSQQSNQPANKPTNQPTIQPTSQPANPTDKKSATSELRTSEGLEGLSNAPNDASTNIDSVSPHILFLLFTPR